MFILLLKDELCGIRTTKLFYYLIFGFPLALLFVSIMSTLSGGESGLPFMMMLVANMVFVFIVPIITSGLISDINNGAVSLFVARGVSRTTILSARWLAYFSVFTLVLSLSLLLSWVVSSVIMGQKPHEGSIPLLGTMLTFIIAESGISVSMGIVCGVTISTITTGVLLSFILSIQVGNGLLYCLDVLKKNMDISMVVSITLAVGFVVSLLIFYVSVVIFKRKSL